MPAPVYRQMLDVMTRRGGPFAGMDIPEFYTLVEALFTPPQAEINNALSRKPATVAEIAGRIQKDETQTAVMLNAMADQGLCFTTVSDGIRYFQGVPFMPGIFEYQFLPGRSSEREKIIAGLIHRYKEAFNSGFQPVFNPDRCDACEACIGRCPPAALKMGAANVPVVNPDRCFGCALCASGCPQDAILMETRPGWRPPPKTVNDLVAALKREAAGRTS